MTSRISMSLKRLWRFYPCRKSVGDVSFFFILLVFQVSFSFFDDAIVAEDGIDSENEQTITLQKLNKKIYLGISITVKSPIKGHSNLRTPRVNGKIHMHRQNHGQNPMQNFLNSGQPINGHLD